MRALSRLFTRVVNFTSGRRGDERLKEEIESHLANLTEENVRAGMTPGEACRRARLKIGAMEAIREEYHAEEGLPFVEDLLRDVRYALRVLRKSPVFTVVVMLTLMLGIGANVVVFGVLNAVLLRPLEVSDPSNLYQIRNKPWIAGRLLTTSYPAFEDFQRENTTFSGMVAINAYSNARLSWRENTVKPVAGEEVSANYFDVLGVRPEAGRFFHAADVHGLNSAPYVVLSDSLWRSAFDADPGVIGMIVRLNQRPFTILGVASATFHGTERFVWRDYWIPMENQEQLDGSSYLQSRAWPVVTIIGRLKPGVTPQAATDNLNAIAAELAKEYPKTDRGLPVRLIHPGLWGDDGDLIREFLYSVTALALLVLAAACANLASLFAARVSDRSRELALRLALGSSRWRLVRQLLTEAVIVSLMGGAAGLATAHLLLGALNRWHPAIGHLEINVDAGVYLAGLVLTLGSAFFFGIVPARQIWESSPLQLIKGGPGNSLYPRKFALRDLLLGGQIAICMVLITASLVAVRGMVRALHAPLGVRPQGAMLVEMDLSQVPGDIALEKEKTVMEVARSIPGVTAVGAVNDPPTSGGGAKGIPVYRPGTIDFTLNNYALATREYLISPGYLSAAGTRLLGGRDVSWQDTTKTPPVAIVNETFARKMWGALPAVGQRFLISGRLTEVVGVAEDGKYKDLTESSQPALFLPLSQSGDHHVVFVVRSLLAPNEIAGALKRTLSTFESDVPISLQSWPDALEPMLFPARAATVALGVMGLLGAMLAMTGIFGMAAYNVSRRMKELGIRAALGASRTQVILAAVGRPMTVLGVGSLLGLLAGLGARPLLGHIVYQAKPGDPVVLAGAMLMMTLIGIAASAIPALRALAVDPSKLMREE